MLMNIFYGFMALTNSADLFEEDPKLRFKVLRGITASVVIMFGIFKIAPMFISLKATIIAFIITEILFGIFETIVLYGMVGYDEEDEEER